MEEWLALPESARIELLDGEFVEKAAPTFEHGLAQGRTVGAIGGAYNHLADGYLLAVRAGRGERVRAEPFDSIELRVSVLFGADNDG